MNITRQTLALFTVFAALDEYSGVVSVGCSLEILFILFVVLGDADKLALNKIYIE